MDARSRSTGPEASRTAVERADAPGKPGHRRRAGRWLWLIVAAGLVALKAQGLAELLHHRTVVIVLIGLWLASSLLRARPVGIAVTVAALFAFALDPRSLVLGIAVGFGALTLLMALFIAIATVLHTRQNHDRARE